MSPIEVRVSINGDRSMGNRSIQGTCTMDTEYNSEGGEQWAHAG